MKYLSPKGLQSIRSKDESNQQQSKSISDRQQKESEIPEEALHAGELDFSLQF